MFYVDVRLTSCNYLHLINQNNKSSCEKSNQFFKTVRESHQELLLWFGSIWYSFRLCLSVLRYVNFFFFSFFDSCFLLSRSFHLSTLIAMSLSNASNIKNDIRKIRNCARWLRYINALKIHFIYVFKSTIYFIIVILLRPFVAIVWMAHIVAVMTTSTTTTTNKKWCGNNWSVCRMKETWNSCKLKKHSLG